MKLCLYHLVDDWTTGQFPAIGLSLAHTCQVSAFGDENQQVKDLPLCSQFAF